MFPPGRRCHADQDHRRRDHRSGQRPRRQRRPLDQGRGDRRRSARRAGRSNHRRIGLHRHGRRHRHPFPYRRRQREHRAAAAAGAACRAQSAAGGDAALQRRLVDLRDRLPLRQDGLHHGGRAGHVAGRGAAYPSRARRHPDHRQGDAGDARQRRFPAVDDPRRRLSAA